LTSGSGSSKTQINAGAIAGGVTGGVALIAALVLFYFLFYRRRKRGGVFEYRTVNPKDILEAGT
jgi:multisubunit Na+/H+ antiporter MnhB subunit